VEKIDLGRVFWERMTAGLGLVQKERFLRGLAPFPHA